jgi:DNA-binding MarR family transcriptional regulator
MLEQRLNLTDIDSKVIFTGVVTFALIMRIGEKKLKEFDLSLGEFGVLLTLNSHKKEINLSTVKQNAYLFSGASITKVAEKLLTKGYITRRENPKSRREKLVRITPSGEKLIEKIMQVLSTLYPAVLEGVKESTKSRLLKDINDIMANVVEMKGRV